MTINEYQNKIISDMAELEDWFEKYQYLIDLGKQLPVLPESLKIDDNAIPGCQSNAWVFVELKDKRLYFQMESDSAITRGMMMLLFKVLNEQTPKDVVKSKLYFLKEIGLLEHLSPSRANGLHAVVSLLKMRAQKFYPSVL